MLRHTLRFVVICAPAIACVGTAPSTQPAHGINIVLSFDAAGSDYPAFDPAAAGLISLFNRAEDYYEDIFEDNTHTLNITYRYDDLNGGLTGLHNPTSFEGAAPFRENGALIRIDTTTSGGALRNWFIDPTPADDSEFAMGQTFWRNLTTGTTGQQNDWYNATGANVPDTFEAGFTGNATDPAAQGGARDMLTTILHEVGHALGMSGANPLTTAETGDGDYDYNPVFTDGESFGVETANNSGDDNLNIAHLESTFAVMNPGGPNQQRRYPSHTDLFAMATVNQYGTSTVDVPRREFYSGSNWNNPANWSGNRTPDSNDDAFIRAAQGPGTNLTATLSVADTARNLTVAEGANFRTAGFALLLGEDLTLSDTDTDVFIDPGGLISADQVFIQNNAELRIDSGSLFADDITIDETADLIGHGTVTLDNDFADLNNNGRIAANGDGTLTFNSDNDIAFDLDGSDGDGIVHAINGSLVFNSALTDTFSSEMTVGPGQSIEFSSSIGFNSNALLLLDGSAAGDATIDASLITMSGSSIVRADGPAVVDASLVLDNSSAADGNSVSSSFEFNGTVNFQGGDVTGDGLAIFNGNIFVTQNATVSITAVDLDGAAGNNTVTISPGRELDITGIAIETGSGDGFDGTININGGTLAITPNWRLDGDLNLTETAGNTSVLDGPGEITVASVGQITVVGDAEINAPLVVDGTLDVGQFASPPGITNAFEHVEFNDTADVNVETGSFLDLENGATYRGGTHTGVGTLRWNGTIIVTADTGISVVNFDWDGSSGDTTTTVNLGATLSINSSSLDSNPASPMDGTVNLNSAHLNVIIPWTLAGQINTQVLAFNPTTPTINGFGGLTVAGTGEILSTGDAEINTNVVSNGLIQASEGTTFINGEITFNPTSSTVAFTPTFGFDDGATVQLNGETTYNGGFYGGNGILRQNGDATVVSPTTIDVGRFDADGNVVGHVHIDIDADLTLNVEQLDEAEGIGRLDFNRHDGFFDVASGAALTVNLPDGAFWVAARAVTLGDTGGAPAQLNGSTVWFGNSQFGGLVLNAHHLAEINASSHFLSDVFVNVPLFGQDRLDINAPTTFAGGSYGGAGLLAVNDTATIRSDTTFSTAQIDLDGATPSDHLLLIEEDATLTINNALAIDTDDPFHDDPIELEPNAHLVVNTVAPWNLGPQGSILLNDTVPATASVSGQTLISSGHIQGNGTFDTDLVSRGTVAPGLSAGQITVTHDYTQAASGVLHIEIAGTTPATEHDQLDVTNTAHLAGTLLAELIDDHTPAYGDLHQIIIAADVVDTFDTHLGLLIDTTLALAPLYSPVDLTLRASIPGDLNFDDVVSVADLSTFALFFDTTQPFYDPDTDTNSWELGDFNTDGAITVADLSLLALNFGFDASDPANPLPGDGLTFAAAARMIGLDPTAIPGAGVPEPGTMTLLTLGTLWLRARRLRDGAQSQRVDQQTAFA